MRRMNEHVGKRDCCEFDNNESEENISLTALIVKSHKRAIPGKLRN